MVFEDAPESQSLDRPVLPVRQVKASSVLPARVLLANPENQCVARVAGRVSRSRVRRVNPVKMVKMAKMLYSRQTCRRRPVSYCPTSAPRNRYAKEAQC